MSKTFLAVLAASTLLAGAAFAAGTTTSTTTQKTATATPLVPFKGAVSSFKAGTDSKTANVSDKAGDWFTLSFNSVCKPLSTAKSVKLSQNKTGGWLVSGKSKCKVSSFSTASNDAATAPAMAPAATTAPTTTTPAPTTPAPATPATH